MATDPVWFAGIQTKAIQFNDSDGTTGKTIFTATVDTRIMAFSIHSTAAANVIIISHVSGGVTNRVGYISVPANAGQSSDAVRVLPLVTNSYNILGVDPGLYVVDLAAGDTLFARMNSTIATSQNLQIVMTARKV